jgi:hypothetical protein
MFTILIGGLCAFVLENTNNSVEARVFAARYPAVAIGFIGGDTCRVGLALADGQSTPLIPMNGHLHRFRVENIGESSAVLNVDGNHSFPIPRSHVS